MNNLYFAKSVNGLIPRGSILTTEPTATNQNPIITKEFETYQRKGEIYLLTDKEPLESIGTIQTPQGNELYFQKSQITYRYNQNLELQEISSNWISKGAITNKGRVVEIGDEIVVCENNGEIKPFLKKSLLPIETPLEIANQERSAVEYMGRLEKSLNAMSPAMPRQQNDKPKYKMSFANQKAQAVPVQEHTEGETRQFGQNDSRQLSRSKSGVLRWLSVDEKIKQQQEKQKQAQEQSKAKEKQKYEEGTKDYGAIRKLFRIGRNVLVGGENAEVIDYGNDIVAVKKGDGTTVTIRASEHINDQPARGISQRNVEHENPEDVARREREKRGKQSALDTDIHENVPRNKYYEEQQAIIEDQKSLPEYQKFQSEQEKDGWTKDIATPFRYVKDVSFVSSMGNLRTGTAEKVWRPEKKDFDYYFDGQGFNVNYEGKQYAIVGMNESEIEIRDELGNKKTVKNSDLDQYRGQVILDAEGNARVKNAGGEEFSLELNEGLTQEDLFKPGIVKIIRDEVWKSIKNAEGAVVDDVKLGRIRKGIVFYKHGNETGVLDENQHVHQVEQGDVKRDMPELNDKLKDIQKEVKKVKDKLDKKNAERQDVETVKARILIGNQNVPYRSTGKELDADQYKDVFDSWMKDGGSGIDEQIAGSYTNPEEWKANVLSLAERMRVEDVKRTSEIDALNDTAKSGLIIEAKPIAEIETYLETAKDILMSRRKEFLRSKQTEKDETSKFQWDEAAELPDENSGAIVSDDVKIIRDSRNDSYQVQYAFVPKKDVIASNDINGKANEEHPSELQARERSQDEASNLQMKNIAENPNEELVEDNKDATRGAPVAFTKGGKVYIVQGNGRTGAVLGMEGQGKEKYFGMMLQKAKEMGIPTDKINDDMMLVRTLSPVHTYEDARKLGAFGQKSSALPMTEVEEARSFQNAQRLKFGLNLNLTGIGRRSINEKNVGAFIRNNPQVYQKILKLSGYDPIAVQYRPAEQAKVVNTALLAQLDKGFIRTVSRKGEDTHELVKVTAPIIADNQKDIEEGTVPPNGDIQKLLKNSIEQYDTLNSTTKNILKVDKNGNIPFLETGEEGRKNPDSLISRMRQEAIEFGDKKSGNIFRNPLNVIGLIAYHQAMNPRDPEKKDAARELFALKMKRFGEAMKTVKSKGEQGADIFAAQLSPEQQARQQQEDIIKIAERVFLENKPYREENPEEMSAEEREAGKETYAGFNAYKKMQEVAKEFEFDLEHNKLKKSLLSYLFKSRVQKQYDEIQLFKSQQNLFGEGSLGTPKPKKVYKPEVQIGIPQVGQVKKFSENDTRILKPAAFGKLRWFNNDEQKKQKEAGLFENIPDTEKEEEPKAIRTKEYRDRQQLIDSRKETIRITSSVIETLTDAIENPKWEASRKEYPEDAKDNVRKLVEAKRELVKQEKELIELESVHKKETEIEDRQKPIFKKALSSIFSFFKKSQLDMFGAPQKPKQPTNTLNWKSMGQEKPNHKYIRRERNNKTGEWIYYYKNAEGKEYAGDKTGKELPKHYSWKEGDTVIHDGKKYSLGEFGNTVATIWDKEGLPKVVRIKELTHESEHQKNLVNEHESKWDRVVEGLQRDLESGEKSGEYEFADSKAELQRKIKYAIEEHDKRKGNNGSQNDALKVKTPESTETAIPEFKSTNEAVEFGKKATPEQIEQLRAKQKELTDETAKLKAEKKTTEALEYAFKGQFVREAIEAAEGKEDSSVSIHEKSHKADTVPAYPTKEPASSHTGAGSISKDQIETPEKGNLLKEYKESKKKFSKSIKSFFKDMFKARKETDTNPSDAQKEAGNYSKGEVEIHGLKIAIENPKGSLRKGISKNGEHWQVRMPADYGYFKERDENGIQLKGKDKDEIDVFIGSDPTSEKVFIVNQIVPDSKELDEHKTMLCFADKRHALRAYKRSYTDNAAKRIGNVVEMTMDEFKDWLKNGNKNKFATENNKE
jgi:hypothetical protein